MGMSNCIASIIGTQKPSCSLATTNRSARVLPHDELLVCNVSGHRHLLSYPEALRVPVHGFCVREAGRYGQYQVGAG